MFRHVPIRALGSFAPVKYVHISSYSYIDSKMIVTIIVTVSNRTNGRRAIRQGTQVHCVKWYNHLASWNYTKSSSSFLTSNNQSNSLENDITQLVCLEFSSPIKDAFAKIG